jgi:hypothetical protein
MRHVIVIVVFTALLLMATKGTRADTNGTYDLTWFSIDGGGGQSSGSGYAGRWLLACRDITESTCIQHLPATRYEMKKSDRQSGRQRHKTQRARNLHTSLIWKEVQTW